MSLKFDLEDLNLSIPDRFAQVLSQVSPDVPAYVGNGTMTYGELDRQSAGLAEAIIARLGPGAPGRQRPVALLLPVSPAIFVGYMGVLRTGHFFVPLETNQTVDSLKLIVEDCAPELIVATSGLAGFARELAPDSGLLVLEDVPERRDWAGPPVEARGAAAMLYTSGSTGRPRGVMRPHALMMATAHHAFRSGVNVGTPVAFLNSYAVAGGQRGSFGSLLLGATAYGGRFEDFTPPQLCRWLAEHRIHLISAPPGIFRAIAALEAPHPMPDLHAVVVGMEPISRKDIEGFARHVLPGTRFEISFATTECGPVTSYAIVTGQPWEGEQTHCGSPDPWADIVILDEALQPVPEGTVGQIGVRMRLQGGGYWNRPEDTRQRFLPDAENPELTLYLSGDLGLMTNGHLEHRGRIDFMLKIRGHRVEPQSIESALASHPGVQEAVVTAFKDKRGNSRLVAYYIAKASRPTPAQLREHLEGTLSSHEIPGRFVECEAFPRLVSGKVDRKALPPPGTSRPELATEFVAPRTDDEAKLADLWAEVLELEQVGVEDNFYQLGGDSLSALEMVHRTEELFGRPIPDDFYLTPTVADLLALWRGEDVGGGVQADDYRAPGRPMGAPRRLMVAVYRGLSAVGAGPFTVRAVSALAAVSARAAWWLRRSWRVEVSQYFWARRRLPQNAGSPFHALNAYLIHGVWGMAYERLRPSDAAPMVQVHGREHFERARAAGPIICVSYHTHSQRYGRGLFPSLGVTAVGIFPVKVVGQRDAAAAANTQLLKTAERSLRAGKVVYLFPDGDRGTRSVLMPFLGVTKEFYPGFAELAARENAQVVPYFIRMDRCGRLHAQFEAPFDDDRGASREDRVRALQGQYVGFMERRWKRDIMNVRFKDVTAYHAAVKRNST